MTVSRVINHPDQVSPELMTLVQQAIEAVGYVPNQVARALVNQRHYVIRFLLLEDVATVEPNYAKLLIRLAHNLQQKGYTLEISLDITAETQSIDGIIVSGWRQEDLLKLQTLDVPVTLYGAAPPNCPLSSVDVDNRAGIEKATEYMWRQGYRDIYYIGLSLDLPFAKQREAGYRSVMAQKGGRVNRYASNELNAQFELPTAIVCATDRIALGVLRAVQRVYHIPRECGVIGFDGVFIDQLTQPQLTTVRQPFALIAEKIVAQIISQIESENTLEVENTSILPDIVVRETTNL
ncbi:hypothetical protein Pfo_031469 [Paulownia fortunei]|nr:hypothetical protein Pfo_031469 [Paulownia fortunei]